VTVRGSCVCSRYSVNLHYESALGFGRGQRQRRHKFRSYGVLILSQRTPDSRERTLQQARPSAPAVGSRDGMRWNVEGVICV
jgi:hypothetical protein